MVLLFGLVYGIIFVSDNKSKEVYAESITSSNSNASLTIAENDLHTTAAPGSVAYASTNVSYSTTNVENYTLKISYAENYNSLKGDSVDATNISNVVDNTLTDNSWGYAWSNDNTITENNFSGLTYSSVPSYNNGNNLASGNTNISNGTGKLIFAAKFANNAVTTNYKTSVLLALATTPSAITYTLSFNSNTTDSVSNMPSNQTCQTTGSSCSITIPNITPTRTGYDFQGWSMASGANNTVTNAANTSIAISTDTSLYAVWKAQGPAVSGFNGITQMQQMTSSICSGATANATGRLYDTRDNSTYTVKKIGSKCWMTQSLRLSRETIQAKDLANTTGRITSSDSNISASYYDIPMSVAVTSNTTTGNDTASVFAYDNTKQQVRKSTNSTYGAYYSWCAATANYCSSAASDGAEVYRDICPKGWQLPSGKPGTGTNDFAVAAGLTLTNIYGGNSYWSNLYSPSLAGGTLTVNGASWTAAGVVGTTGLVATGSNGYYWSRTAYDSTNTYFLTFLSSFFAPSYSNERYFGYSIRCVAK